MTILFFEFSEDLKLKSQSTCAYFEISTVRNCEDVQEN